MTVLEHFGLTKVSPYKVKLPLWDEIIIKSDHLVGIEIEIENVGGRSVGLIDSSWTTAPDNSLRNAGIEFISRPILASMAPTILKSLLIDTLPKDCSFSPRTSVHIHLDMQQMSGNGIVDFVGLYCLFEELLYRFAGRGRNKNIYCIPVCETDLARGLGFVGLRKEWKKYTGLNLCPLSSYGTVEFRHMHGTYDVQKISSWIQLIVCLKDFVINTKGIQKLIASLEEESDWYGLMQEVFGDFSNLLKIKSPLDFYNGMMTAKSIYFNPQVAAVLNGQLTTGSAILSNNT